MGDYDVMRYDATAANAIEATGLVKRFGKTTALDGVDLVARQGRVLGVLGPNGAGKTTAVRILATLLRPDGGQASVCGYDVLRDAHQVRQLIGLTGQYASVDEGLSGINNLIMIGRLLGIPRADARARARELLARFDLTDAAARPAKTYSGGMRRRLDLAASLVGQPRVLYLDEPTTGLDPRSRTDVWGMIRGLVADGVTVLLTTQYLDEADQLADRIAVLDHGRIVAEGTPEELKRRIPGAHISLRLADAESLDAAAKALPGGTRDDEDLVLRVPNEGGIASLRDVLARLGDGVAVEDLSIHTPDLDDVFFALTGNPAKEQTR